MYLSREFVMSTFQNFNFLKKRVKDYCEEIKLDYIPDEDEINIDECGFITITYEINTSCHCHPEYETKRININFDDFFSWLENRDE